MIKTGLLKKVKRPTGRQVVASGFSALVALSGYSIYHNKSARNKTISTVDITNEVTASVNHQAQPTLIGFSHLLTPDDGTPVGVGLDEVPSTLSPLLADGDRVIKVFEIKGLYAWVIAPKNGGNNKVYLTMPESDHMVMTGSLLYQNSRGDKVDLNAQIAKRYSSELAPSQQWESLADSWYIQEGAAFDADAPIVYAFFDLSCEYCHLSWLALRPYVDLKKVNLRWIPVAVLSKESHGQAAHLLEQPDPHAAFTRYNMAWDLNQDQSPFPEAAPESVNVTRLVRVEQNNQFLKDLDLTGAPAFVYKDPIGRINVAKGALSLNSIAEILNTDPIRSEDPRLRLLDKSRSDDLRFEQPQE